MKKHGKAKIRRLINLDEHMGLQKSIHRLTKRYNYLKSKNKKGAYSRESRQMKYIDFHLKKLGAKAQ